jgi:hypothetical protein
MPHATGNKYKTPDNLINLLSCFQLGGKDYSVLIAIGDETDADYRGYNGNRYSDPIEVNNPYNLTEDEMSALTNGKGYEPYSKIVMI